MDLINNKLSKVGMYNWILLFNIMLLLLLSLVIDFRFEENDDVLMMLFASGNYTGIPESKLVFINTIYGLVMTCFYKFSTNINWYPIFFLIFHTFSFSIIVKSIITSENTLLTKIVILILFYCLELRLLLLLQFTTTAAIVTLSGIISIEKTNNKTGILLIVIGSLIRFEASVLVLLVSIPLVFYKLFLEKMFKLKVLIYLFIAITFSVFLKYIDNTIYDNDKEWAEYAMFNKIRGQINDNPNSEKFENHLIIKKEDYSLFLGFFGDPHKISLDKVVKIDNNINEFSSKINYKNIYVALRNYTTYFFLILMFVFILCFSGNLSRAQISSLFIYFVILILINSFISLNGTLKSRVFLSTIIPFLYYIFTFYISENKKLLNVLLISTILCFVSIFSYRTFKIHNQRFEYFYSQYKIQENLVAKYVQIYDENLIVYGADYNIELKPIFSNYNNLSFLTFNGWLSKIPYNFNKFNSYKEFINEKKIFIKRNNFSQVSKLLKISIKNNYNLNVVPIILMSTNEYVIFNFLLKKDDSI